ncbi:MAG TPA: LysE family translocator [Gammaproteobacteria bacterium]|jgi:threonine/homoserine/homoserine lactone efflux protein|nr:LysE family translocator [Gammaproteobacteria bacterium]
MTNGIEQLVPPWPSFAAFLVASLVLAVTPGPGVFYIVSRSAVHGWRQGLVSVTGVALGNLGNAFAASLGLAAVFAVSALAFSVVKYAGAAYLVYLGVRMLRSRAPAAREIAEPVPFASARVFRDGFIVALLNPKTALFFAAFLPQFLSASSTVAQSMTLGALFVGIAAVTDSGYALAAGSLAPQLRRRGAPRLGRWIGGGAFIGLGLFAAFGGSRGAK